MSKYTTGELAKLCGVSVRTVQYYDSRDILKPNELSDGGRRLYSQQDLERMKIICFLRELDIPIKSIGELLAQEHPEEVISILLSEQEQLLSKEISDKQFKLDKLKDLKQTLKGVEQFSVESIGDVAYIMENKNKLRKIHATMLISGIPIGILQWVSIILWIVMGLWQLFLVYVLLAVPYGILISKYYFKKVAYICPHCHKVFQPKLKQAFWASHTPKTRKLTCPDCGYKGFCVETYAGDDESNKS